MIENTTGRQWLGIIAAGLVFLMAWLVVPSIDAPIAVIGALLALGGGFGLAWRLLDGR